MLFVLTGDVQIGKSRWLDKAVDRLHDLGIESYGVISAGIWVESDSQRSNDEGFEKLGIESILLPERERFLFAQRSDLAKENGSYVQSSQAGRIGLGWHIDDAAIERVNAHFVQAREIYMDKATMGDEFDEDPQIESEPKRLLIVDELGRLELEKDMGFTDALALLKEGSSDIFRHALIVVRSELVDIAIDRFSEAWGGAMKLAPNDQAIESIASQY